MITPEQNAEFIANPTKDEVKHAVFVLNNASAGGPDGYTGMFFQACWDIIGDDIYNMVWDFFGGMQLPGGRSIVENILLTQEIISDIRLKTNKGKKNGNQIVPNVVMKLDMTKAYDRLSWLFLTNVMRRMGFSERGKASDPLSPTLFILTAKVLSRALNSLNDNLWYTGFGCIYRHASGFLINKAKSSVYLHDRVDEQVFQKVQRITGITRQAFPLMYLGCPIYYSRSKMCFYSDLLAKVRNKLQGWKGKLLSFGGRAILLKHVLQAMTMHLLSAIDPPSFVITKLHKIFAQFY
ncbi:uncharacterized protein LOC132042904 [Lycium ferocissimum]|uniref:uncharacterized protein LOC132042904 n=1 Tax=Lycium ferocissimum TaxID=112874 RepID=UPI0028160554|nr:uncharacterized protein LOC132042904 [Lycium ferocissimum]